MTTETRELHRTAFDALAIGTVIVATAATFALLAPMTYILVVTFAVWAITINAAAYGIGRAAIAMLDRRPSITADQAKAAAIVTLFTILLTLAAIENL